jgi:hypothetical protein
MRQGRYDNTPLFRSLTTEEEQEFRQWARDTWKPGMEVKDIWHPIVRDEIEIMQRESQSTVWCAQCDTHHLTSELPGVCSRTILPTKGGFIIRRKECQTCGEPPFGDEYTCACKVH